MLVVIEFIPSNLTKENPLLTCSNYFKFLFYLFYYKEIPLYIIIHFAVFKNKEIIILYNNKENPLLTCSNYFKFLFYLFYYKEIPLYIIIHFAVFKNKEIIIYKKKDNYLMIIYIFENIILKCIMLKKYLNLCIKFKERFSYHVLIIKNNSSLIPLFNYKFPNSKYYFITEIINYLQEFPNKIFIKGIVTIPYEMAFFMPNLEYKTMVNFDNFIKKRELDSNIIDIYNEYLLKFSTD